MTKFIQNIKLIINGLFLVLQISVTELHDVAGSVHKEEGRGGVYVCVRGYTFHPSAI